MHIPSWLLDVPQFVIINCRLSICTCYYGLESCFNAICNCFCFCKVYQSLSVKCPCESYPRLGPLCPGRVIAFTFHFAFHCCVPPLWCLCSTQSTVVLSVVPAERWSLSPIPVRMINRLCGDKRYLSVRHLSRRWLSGGVRRNETGQRVLERVFSPAADRVSKVDPQTPHLHQPHHP
jgi:hypothetical protein